MKQTRKAKGIANQAVSAERAIDAAQNQDDATEHAQKVIYGRPYISVPQINSEFRRKSKKKDSGSNEDSMVDVFLKTMEHITSEQPSFSFDDVIALLRIYQFPNLELKALFDRWIQEMTLWHKVTVCSLVYDSPVYLIT